MKTVRFISAIFIIMPLGCFVVVSQPANNSSDDDAAWKQLQQAAVMPVQPKPTNGETLTQGQMQQFYAQTFIVATVAAKKAKAFYTQFPGSSNTIAAKKLECSMLRSIFNQDMASQSAFDKWQIALNALQQDPKLAGNDRFDVLMEIAESKLWPPQLDWKAREAQYEPALQQMIKEYPQRDAPYEDLLALGAAEDENKARSFAIETLAAPVSDSVKAKAQGLLHRLDAAGKTLDIKFTALDGRAVDLSQMRGKVVLVNFWATSCGPCIEEIPNIKDAYDKFHSKGFEVVGISFDPDKARLQDFIQTRDIPWPQYFGGDIWQNKFGAPYGIYAIPVTWLLDKKGILRESNACDDLQGKVEKLLAE